MKEESRGITYAVPTVLIVGRSSSGKTMLIQNLVVELTRRGYRVGTVKHAPHGFRLDVEGKDSAKHFEAGATTVVLAGPEEVVVRQRVGEDRPARIAELVATYLKEADIVLVEGFHGEPGPKIEVIGSSGESAAVGSPLSDGGELQALVTEGEPSMHQTSAPHFGPHEIGILADLVERRIILIHQHARKSQSDKR